MRTMEVAVQDKIPCRLEQIKLLVHLLGQVQFYSIIVCVCSLPIPIRSYVYYYIEM